MPLPPFSAFAGRLGAPAAKPAAPAMPKSHMNIAGRIAGLGAASLGKKPAEQNMFEEVDRANGIQPAARPSAPPRNIHSRGGL